MSARGMLVAAVLLAAPSSQAAEAPPCDDCKYKPCLQGEISRANRMREMYSRIGQSARTMEDYQASVDADGARILAEEQERVKGNPACATRFPDLNDMVEQRKWQQLGWGIQFDDNKKARGVNFSAATNAQKCTLRQSQIDKLKEMLPCLAIGEATEAHEKDHVERCIKAKPTTPKQMGEFEVNGYKAELKVLNDAKSKLDRKCRPPPSISDAKPRDASKEHLRRSMNRVSTYAATL